MEEPSAAAAVVPSKLYTSFNTTASAGLTHNNNACPILSAPAVDGSSGSILGHFISVMSPVGGPSFLSRWQQGVQVYPPPVFSGRSRRGSDATSTTSQTESAFCADQKNQQQLSWMMRLLLLDCSPPHARIREDHVDIQVNSAIRLVQIEQLDIVCVCLSWREQSTDAADEFTIPMYCIVIYMHIRFAERLHAMFPSIRDRLEIALRRILSLMDSIEQTGEEQEAAAAGSHVLSCTDPRLAKAWDPEVALVASCIEQWISSKVERIHLDRAMCEMTVLRELALPPKQSRYANGTVQSVVSAAMTYHRCIIVSDNAEEALRWVRTVCLFLSDDQLQQSSLKIATTVDQIIPDARIQGLVLEPQSLSSSISLASSPAVVDQLPRKLLEFRYPVVVINVRRHVNANEHIVPESLSSVLSLKRYREQRFEALTSILETSSSSGGTSTTTANRLAFGLSSGKISLSSLRKVSGHVAAFMFQLQKIVESVNNAALRDSRTFTNRSTDSSGGGQQPSSSSAAAAATASSKAFSSLLQLLTPRHPTAGSSASVAGGVGDQTRSVDSLEVSGRDTANNNGGPLSAGRGDDATLTPPLAVPPPSLVSPAITATSATNNSSSVTFFTSYSVDHTEAARWDNLAARYICPLMQRWRHAMMLRAVQHAFLEMDKYVRNALPAVPEEDTDLLCCLMERIPLELADHRVHQAIQTISSRMKAF